MSSASGLSSDLLLRACCEGTEDHVQLALDRCPLDINKQGAHEATPLHMAVWRNHRGVVEKLLSTGAQPDAQDGESGWTSVHRALYGGNLASAQLLLSSGASLDVTDHQGRTPLDLLSQELHRGGQRHLLPNVHHQGASGFGSPAPGSQEGGSQLFCWGSGANFQLGTGSRDFHSTPTRVEALGAAKVTQLAAAKFHSAAVDASGRLYTWGHGRGGRLGHPDQQIHSGEKALIHPWVVSGLGKRQVTSLGAGKHHMLIATSAGEVFSWGSNRDGKLGYAGVDTQPVPKKVALLRQRCSHVAASNKHSAAITTSGEIYTWGSNGHGQLGYGTPASDSAGNSTPRLVEALKGRSVSQVSLSKRHSVILTAEGDPFTWGHKVVTPRRVNLGVRDSPSTLSHGIHFHKGYLDLSKPVAKTVAAGFSHTTVVTMCGSVLLWASSDPLLRVLEVHSTLSGKRAVAVSASKHRTAVITEQGEVYCWESQRESAWASSPTAVVPERVMGIRRVAAVAVGEKHTLVAISLALPGLPDACGRVNPFLGAGANEMRPHLPGGGEDDDGDDEGMGCLSDTEGDGSSHDDDTGVDEFGLDDSFAHLVYTPASSLGLEVVAGEWEEEGGQGPLGPVPGDLHSSSVPSLQSICQCTVAKQLVEPRSVLRILDYADIVEARVLRSYAIAYTLQNLDAVLQEARASFESLPLHLVVELERRWKTWLIGDDPSSDRRASLTGGGRTPLMGTSPGSAAGGGSLPRGSLMAGASWVDRWGGGSLTGTSPATPRRGHDFPQLFSGLRGPLPGRRPSGAPSWMAGKALMMPPPPSSGANGSTVHRAELRALEAMGHTSTAAASSAAVLQTGSPRLCVGGEAAMGSGSSGRAAFASQADVEAASRDEAVSRMLRNLRKKVQQAESLEAQRAAGARLDAQQLLKLGQRVQWEEAILGLQAGVPLEAVQAALAQSQDLAARLSSSSSSTVPIKGVPPSAEPFNSALPTPASATPGAKAESSREACSASGKKGGGGSSGKQTSETNQASKPSRPKDEASTAVAVEILPSSASEHRAMPAAGSIAAAASRATAAAAAAAGKAESGLWLTPSLMEAETHPILGVNAMDMFSLGGGSASVAGGISMPIAASAGGYGSVAGGTGPSSHPPSSGAVNGVGTKKGNKGDKVRDKARKGGLSMFLSGALEVKDPPPAPKPSEPLPKGPAWGGAALGAVPALSLRDAMSKQQPSGRMDIAVADSRQSLSATKGSNLQPSPSLDAAASSSSGRVLLGDFLSPSQVVRPASGLAGSRPSGSSPAWGGAGGAGGAASGAAFPLGGCSPPSAPLPRASLRHIQEEQQTKASMVMASSSTVGGARKMLNASRGTAGCGPGGSSSKGGAPLILGSSPPSGASPVTNKWYIPDRDHPLQNIAKIQTEEEAIAQLQQRYGSKVTVRVARPKFGGV